MNAFLISAPYQLLSAMEAVHRFALEDNLLVIIDTGHFQLGSFERMIDRKAWRAVQHYDFRYRLEHLDFGLHPPTNAYQRLQELYLTFSQASKRWRANTLARSLGPVENLFLGNYLADYDLHMRHIANRVRFRNLFLLDVGTDTLRICADRRNEAAADRHSGTADPSTQRMSWRRRLRRKYVDWDAAGVEQLTFFTSYDLEVSGRDRVVKNEYDYLRTLAASKTRGDEVWFIGQPLADQGYLTWNVFQDCLKGVVGHFHDRTPIYISHPRESDEQLQMAARSGLQVRRLDVPVEYALGTAPLIPCCIASFFSSAIENCASIFGTTLDVKTFRIPERDFLKDTLIVTRIYQNFAHNKKLRIEVVDLEPA